METFDILLSILNLVVYFCMVTLVCYLFSKIRHYEKQMDFISGGIAKIYAVTSAIKLQYNFDKITEMQNILNKLVKEENYEEAQKVRAVIENALKQAKASLESFKEAFGDDIDTNLVTIHMNNKP